MDIHQTKAPHNWRELAREIGIIVVGVLIALFFEQLVDFFQWTSRVRAAESAMRWELLWDNGPQIYQRAAMHPCLVQKLNEMRAAVQHDEPRQQIAALTASYSLDWLTYDSVAEQQALASDVSSHMPQQEMEDFATAYSQMPAMDRIAEREDYDIGQLHGLNQSGGPLTATEKEKVLDTVAALRTDDSEMWKAAKWIMPNLRSLGSLDPVRTGSFMKSAREHYGACVKNLPADFPKGIPWGPEPN